MVTEEVDDGALIHGLFMEGARWNDEDMCVAESFLKDLHPVMPVLHAFAKQSPAMETRIGGPAPEYYVCPVFVTSARGATYSFTATLKLAETPDGAPEKGAKWVLAGVAMLMSEE